MKAKMKSLTLFWTVPVLALALLVVLSTSLAGPARDPVTGSGSSSAINDYQFAGSATFVIRGEEKSTLEAPDGLLVTLLEEPEESDEGVLHVVATHTFTFADGSITTSDKEIAEPTSTPGLYTLNANMKVVSGTGVYEGVSGHLTAHGTIDFRPYQYRLPSLRSKDRSPTLNRNNRHLKSLTRGNLNDLGL